MANYDWDQQSPAPPQPQRKAGGGLFLIIIVVMLFLVFRGRFAQPQPGQEEPRELPGAGAPSGHAGLPPIPPAGGARDTTREGDWTLEDVPASESTSADAGAGAADQPTADPAAPKSTTQGDWQIEEVPTDQNADGSPAEPAGPAPR